MTSNDAPDTAVTHEMMEQRYYHTIQPVLGDDAVTVVFVISEKFCKYFAAAFQSLIDNSTRTRGYDIVIMHSDVTEKNMDIIRGMAPENFTVRFFNVNDTVKELFSRVNLKVRAYWDVSTYYRCFIPILMNDYRKVLYLDSDMIFNNIDGLFDMDFEGK